MVISAEVWKRLLCTVKCSVTVYPSRFVSRAICSRLIDWMTSESLEVMVSRNGSSSRRRIRSSLMTTPIRLQRFRIAPYMRVSGEEKQQNLPGRRTACADKTKPLNLWRQTCAGVQREDTSNGRQD